MSQHSNMRPLLVLCSCLMVAFLPCVNGRMEVLYSFNDYVRQYTKHYDEKEYLMRSKIFEQRVSEIKTHNMGGKNLFRRGINELSDWTDVELAALNGARPHMMKKLQQLLNRQSYRRNSRPLPHHVDYRTKVPPVLTAIKNQGHCGSCWAHSAVEAMESHWAITTGKLHVLSQQQVTSCTPNPHHCGGFGGCEGSIESLAFDYVSRAGGIHEEWAYSYSSFYGETGACENRSAGKVAKVSTYVQLPANDQGALMDAVAFVGPIAVSVDASLWSSYTGGIFDACDYSKNITQNHAVQLVGYGHDYESGKDYWIVRNSWGPLWGEDGYIRLLRESKPRCGWSVDTHSGAACDGDPDEEWVCGMCGILSGSTYPVMDAS